MVTYIPSLPWAVNPACSQNWRAVLSCRTWHLDRKTVGIGLIQQPPDQSAPDSGAAQLRLERGVDDEDLVAGVVDDEPSGQFAADAYDRVDARDAIIALWCGRNTYRQAAFSGVCPAYARSAA